MPRTTFATALLVLVLGAAACAGDPVVDVTDGDVIATEVTIDPTDDADADDGQDDAIEDDTAQDDAAESASGDTGDADDEIDLGEDPIDPEADGPLERVEMIAPEPGGEAVTLTGTLVEGSVDTFLVDVPTCCTGETLYLTVVSPDGQAVAEVLDPQFESVVTNQTDVVIEVDEAGQWEVLISGPAGVDYVLELGIAVDAS
jgi:hypothetical protein